MSKKDHPDPVPRFVATYRIEAYERALDHGLHLVRDNFHLWAIRASDKVHVWLCSSKSYDGLWREACRLFKESDFDTSKLPYAMAETDTSVTIYNPVTQKAQKIDKKDLRRRRSEVT